MRRRVLIVVSSYRPAMLADMQRARILAWELPKLGWDVEILTPAWTEVRADAVEGDWEPFFNPDTTIHEVRSSGRHAFRTFGSRSLTWCTLLPMYRRGRKLLASGRFDVVFVSTTTFAFFDLGALWRVSAGTPYVLDFHDPWAREGRATGSWRALLKHSLDAFMERRAVCTADGLVAVSPCYIRSLQGRYAKENPAWCSPGRHATIPFSACEDDFQTILLSRGHSRPPSDDLAIHYVGAGGPIMFKSFAMICRTLQNLRLQGNAVVNLVRIRLFGTMYGWMEGAPRPLEEIARASGIGDLVREYPIRVSYRRSLELLAEADGALILGVDDVGYMPSKLFTYAISGKPMLAAFHRRGPAYSVLSALEAAHGLWFDDHAEMSAWDASDRMCAFLDDISAHKMVNRKEALRSHSSTRMAEAHASLFEACIGVQYGVAESHPRTR